MAVIALFLIGAVAGAGTGSLSAFGLKDIYLICPLGFLEVALAGRSILLPRLLIGFVVIVGLTVLLGRFFCGWICPVPLVRKLLFNDKKKNPASSDASAPVETVETSALADEEAAATSCPQAGTQLQAAEKVSQSSPSSPKQYLSSFPLIGASLAASAVFGFPVFCLVCPIGLIFATLFALIRLLHFNEPTLDLIIFPAIVILELVFLRKWCSKWCPVGGLLSFISRFNRRLVPAVDRAVCLEESRHVKCGRCHSVCAFNVDIKNNSKAGNISDCAKCGECAASCPVQAIQYPWKRKKQKIS